MKVSSETAQQRLGRLVRLRRQKLKMSVRAAATAAGIDRATWTSLEAGTRNAQDRHHATIEDVLQWPAGTIAANLEDGATPPASADTDHASPADDGGAPLVVRMSADELAELIMTVQDASGREAADKLLADVRRRRAEWAAKQATPAGDQSQAG
jgi:transcriptional regulator with XRE-family HTH domain